MQSQGRKCHLFSSSKRTLPPDMHHRPRRRHKIRLANMVTLFLPSDNAANECNQLLVRSTPEHQFVQIVIPNGKKTSPNLAIGSNSNTATVSAKRMRNRRNDSNLADTIVKAITPRSLAPLMR